MSTKPQINTFDFNLESDEYSNSTKTRSILEKYHRKQNSKRLSKNRNFDRTSKQLNKGCRFLVMKRVQ